MGHHVSKDDKGSSSHLTSQQISTDKASGKTKKKAKTSNSKGGASSKGKMPFLRWQSDQAKKRYQTQIFQAENNPEPSIDVSHCELDEIPEEIYSTCNYLQKEALLLNDNWLTGIDRSDKLHYFKTLRVLHLHNNEIKSLPESIRLLESLQVLNLENNKLSKLPSSIGQLHHLQELNISRNRLHTFPEDICRLKMLRILNISENRIVRLSKQLYQVRTLETLILDADQMVYPSSEVCSKGTEAIMIHICSDNQMEYVPPSEFLSDALDAPPLSPITVSNNLARAIKDEESLQKSVDDYNNLMDKRRLELAEIDRRIQQEENEQAEIAVQYSSTRNKYLDEVVQDSDKMDRELEEISHRKEESRRRLLIELEKIENGINQSIEEMMRENKRQKQVELWIDNLEEERMKDDDWCSVKWEEYQTLRKKEILENMQNLLNETNAHERMRLHNVGIKDSTMQAALYSSEAAENEEVENVLLNREIGQTVVSDLYIHQDKAQREAYEALQFQKDARNQRINEQIAMVEEELYNLTVIELEKRKMRADQEISLLEEKRASLIKLLEQLMVEQEKRKIELKKRLIEMEKQREDEETDYWLVQYQRLLDRKPQAVIDRERQLATDVVNILEDSDAVEYIPVFTRHGMTPETLLEITDEELRQIGVHQLGTRKAILRNIEQYRNAKKKEALLEEKEVEAEKSPHPSPSAPGKGKRPPKSKLEQLEQEEAAAECAPHPAPSAPSGFTRSSSNTTRQLSVVARGINSECVVCMDKQSDVIFLKCGHVCCCTECSQPLKLCPLCRGEIVSRIKLLSNPR